MWVASHSMKFSGDFCNTWYEAINYYFFVFWLYLNKAKEGKSFMGTYFCTIS